MDYGPVKHTMVAMDEGSLFVMSISDGSLLGVHGSTDCDMGAVAYHMALFVGRAGHVLTPNSAASCASPWRTSPPGAPVERTQETPPGARR
ncbi:hypothetical protein SHKM778_16330 [Streptomyces sp. KM77-8]|uniref:Roadblock/LC7 domain-containing protein n=1 Tax=Streptomyces haneummycinicus TaxID=3074435 RepID=A0AAT9HD61_9ACTN